MEAISAYPTFTLSLLEWFQKNGRKTLPWQQSKSPYRILVSEIMLQQTQVQTVIPYFGRFIQQFPNFQQLANASLDEVLSHWAGLGYYSRGRNLHRTAQIIVNEHQGRLPENINELTKLPGIGPSTAGAIASLAFNLPTPILDGNVVRVLSRYFLVSGIIKDTETSKKLWSLAKDCMPNQYCAEYTQGIMDFGALCCTIKNPKCDICTLNKYCLAYQHNKVTEYPNKPPKKILPIKHQQFLLLYNHHQQIYLEKRPEHGLWGGLWTLPYLENDLCIHQFLKDNYQLEADKICHLIDVKHTFTHFRLYITAYIVEIESINTTMNGTWFSMNTLDNLGVPKPVKDIIKNFKLNNPFTK